MSDQRIVSVKAGPKSVTLWGRLRRRSSIGLSLGLALTAAGWSIMWGVDTYFNALAFWSLWTGASLLAWTLGKTAYPGLRRHVQLAVLSVPLWWWFELINERVQNWRYVLSFDYGPVQYALLTSVAFSTVVPAICAVGSMIRRAGPRHERRGLDRSGNRRFPAFLIVAGAVLQVAVVVFPAQLFPLVWVAPALIFDGLVASTGGRSLVWDLMSGRWTDLLIIAAGGLICGFFWEFWNHWSMPKWEYEIPYLGFWKIFEMPAAGYLGYVPFAWSVVQLVRWLDCLSVRSNGGLTTAIWKPG